jgi:hypothetical protein
MDHQHFNATLTGLVATASGITVSMLPEIEAWLRVSSLIIGCAVGIASFIVIVRKWDVPPKE